MSVSIQFRRGTAAEWTAANPVLLEGELGLELDTSLYKIGDGITAWNALEYGSLSLPSDVIDFVGQSAIPAAPATGNLKLFAKSLGGRMLPRIIGPSGLSTPLQPSFFQNMIVLISTGASTSVTNTGTTVTSVGTISHPTPTEDVGYMANFVTAATGAVTAGTGTNLAIFMRGTTPGKACGFFLAERLYFPDANYNSTGTGIGSRIFAGMFFSTMSVSVTLDDPGGHLAGFCRAHTDTGRQDTNWQFATRDGTAINLTDTGMPFVAQHVYDFYIFCPPAGTTIYWRIDDITAGTIQEGSTTQRLPGATTLLRPGFQLYSQDAVARNIRMQRIYVESDR